MAADRAGGASNRNRMSSTRAVIEFGIRHSKTDPRTQFAALCYRRDKGGKVKVLLVTGRRKGRWKLPKGWPTVGLTPAQTAMKEAFEEAGVRGSHHEQCVGHYVYVKSVNGKTNFPCIVAVFPIKVSRQTKEFPESGERKCVWLTPNNAAKRVEEPSLKSVLEQFDPSKLRR